MFKFITLFSVLVLFFAEDTYRTSPESVGAFMLSAMLGIFGWLGFESGRGKKIGRTKILSTIGMALCAGYMMDAFSWWKEYPPELRAVFVTGACYFSEPTLAFLWEQRKRLFNKFFGSNDKAGQKD